MNPEITTGLTNILTSVSDLQANLLGVPEAGDAMERLCAIRKTALAVMESEGSMAWPYAGMQRQECLEQMDKLSMRIIKNTGNPLPDSTLFRIGAAADNLAGAIKRYAEYRNHAAGERMAVREQEQGE